MEAAPCGADRIDVDDEEVLLELRAARHDLAGRVDHQAVPVEHQFVLSAHGVAEGDEATVVRCPLPEHPLTLDTLAPMIGRPGQVDDELRAASDGRPLAGSTGIPEVLANRHPNPHAGQVDHHGIVASSKVSLFVEDGVVGQEMFPVGRGHRAVGQHCGRIVQVLGQCRKPHEYHGVGDRLGKLSYCVGCRLGEARIEQEIFRRVTGDRQLRKHRQIGALLDGPGGQLLDALEVAGEIADREVRLAQGHSERAVSCRLSGIAGHVGRRWRRQFTLSPAANRGGRSRGRLTRWAGRGVPLCAGAGSLVVPVMNTVTHRGRRGARSARREEGAYRQYSTDKQRYGVGCIGGRMRPHL